jgi:hypothetical protein
LERRTPPRRLLPLLVVPLVALVIASNVGDALAPTLVNEHPVWLMALNARNRNLVLVVNTSWSAPSACWCRTRSSTCSASSTATPP